MKRFKANHTNIYERIPPVEDAFDMTMEKNQPLLELKRIKKFFGNKVVLSDVTLTIRKGEILGIIGTSGGGKSTLFKILLGYYKADAGEILFQGKSILKKQKMFKKIVGYTTQDDSFYKKLTVYENMDYYASLYDVKLRGKELREHITNILKLVHLEQHQRTIVEKMSGGMRRRLNFALSLIHDPEILILDEPTTGLDPLLVEQFWNVIEDVNKRGKTIIVTSHIFPELEEHCNTVAILHKGRIIDTFQITADKTKLHELFEHAMKNEEKA